MNKISARRHFLDPLYHPSYVTQQRPMLERFARGSLRRAVTHYRGRTVRPEQQAGAGVGTHPGAYIPETDEIWYALSEDVNLYLHVYDARTRKLKQMIWPATSVRAGSDARLHYDPVQGWVWVGMRGFGTTGGFKAFDIRTRAEVLSTTYGSSFEHDSCFNPYGREMWISSVDFGKTFNFKLSPNGHFYPGAGGDVPQGNQMCAVGFCPVGRGSIWVGGNDYIILSSFDAQTEPSLVMSNRHLSQPAALPWNSTWMMEYVPVERQMWISHSAAGQGISIWDAERRVNVYNIAGNGFLSLGYDPVRHCMYVTQNANTSLIYVYDVRSKLVIETIDTEVAAGSVRGPFISPYRDLWFAVGGTLYYKAVGV